MTERNIVAIGGAGFGREPYDSRLDDYLLSLTNASGRPNVAFLPQATGENRDYIIKFFQAYAHKSNATWVGLFNRQTQDLRELLLSQDMIYVGGGNTANMLAIWRVHGVDAILKQAWENGTLLAGVSAGAICWFESSVTDSFGPQLDALHDGLAFLPGSFCPHYDGEARRRPVYQGLISSRELPAGHAADDGVAVHYRGTEVHDITSIYPSGRAWRLELEGDASFTETEIQPRPL